MSLLGKPIVVVPYSRPGCVARVWAFLQLWIVRLLVFGLFFGLGYGCRVVGE